MTQKCLPHNGERIRRLAKEKGYTQAQLAEALEYDERSVRKWCQKGVYDYRLLVRIANIFGCSVDDLFLE